MLCADLHNVLTSFWVSALTEGVKVILAGFRFVKYTSPVVSLPVCISLSLTPFLPLSLSLSLSLSLLFHTLNAQVQCPQSVHWKNNRVLRSRVSYTPTIVTAILLDFILSDSDSLMGYLSSLSVMYQSGLPWELLPTSR